MQPHCSVHHMYFVIMYYCVQITSPQSNGLKNPNSHYFVVSVESQESENSLVGCLWLRASRKPAMCLLGLQSHLKAQLGELLQLLAEFSFSRNVRLLSLHWLGASLSSLPWGYLHRAAHNVAAGFPQGERVSEWQSVREHARWKPHPLCNSQDLWVSLSSRKWHPSLLHIIFTRSKSPGDKPPHSREETYIRAEIQEVEITGYQLIGCLPCA